MKKLLALVAAVTATTAWFGTGALAGQSLDDAAIVAIYNQVNSFDIETALLGETKGSSEQVRSLAKMVSGDHTGVRKSANDLAKEIGVAPALPPARSKAAADHDLVIQDLRSKSGAEFDRAYLKHEIAFHKDAINAVRTILMPQARSPKLRQHFAKVLPAFEHHLAQTEEVARQLGAAQ